MQSQYNTLNGRAAFHRFAWGDCIIILCIVLGTIFSVPYLQRTSPEFAVIHKDTILIAKYPLHTDRTIKIEGVIGPVEIEIKNRSISVVSSTCPHRICTHTAPIQHPFQQIVCVPNHIRIGIEGPKKEIEIDAIVR